MSLDRQAPPPGSYRVEGIRGGAFVIAGEERHGAVLLWPAGVLDSPPSIEAASFDPLLALNPPLDIILIGTGKALKWPDAALLETLRARGVGVDVMASQLAARTYNVLIGEDRQVGALLLPLEA